MDFLGKNIFYCADSLLGKNNNFLDYPNFYGTLTLPA